MQISVVNGICKRHDAISEAVRGTVLAVQSRCSAKAKLFTYSCDFEDLPTKIVSNVSDLILDSFFIGSDFVIYHFGVYYELFNAILVGNGRGKQIVYYHNVTPRGLLDDTRHSVGDRS